MYMCISGTFNLELAYYKPVSDIDKYFYVKPRFWLANNRRYMPHGFPFKWVKQKNGRRWTSQCRFRQWVAFVNTRTCQGGKHTAGSALPFPTALAKYCLETYHEVQLCIPLSRDSIILSLYVKWIVVTDIVISLKLQGPLFQHALNLIWAWISNYIHHKVWDKITYSHSHTSIVQPLKFGNG